MKHYTLASLQDVPALQTASAVTVGVFDGLHLGHRAILDVLTSGATKRGLPSVCVTFARHPKAVLDASPPRQILSLEHRLELLSDAGLDEAVVIDFSREFARIEPEAFVEELLVRRLGVRLLVLGHDTALGRERRGDASLLARAGRRYGFHVVTVGAVTVNGRLVSSTSVRQAIAGGDLDRARRMLGRPVSLLGTVVAGDGRGAGLGFPTANLEVRSEAFPPLGVYAVTARCEQGDLPAVMNYGLRPTFRQDDTHAVFEVHALDRDDLSLYGQRMEVFLHAFLRRERRFASAEDLTAQIARDVARAREVRAEGLPPRRDG